MQRETLKEYLHKLVHVEIDFDDCYVGILYEFDDTFIKLNPYFFYGGGPWLDQIGKARKIAKVPMGHPENLEIILGRGKIKTLHKPSI